MKLNNIFEKNENRNPMIDVLKGILIIAVVLGHAASNKNSDLDNNIPFLLCYSWHMFLFMGVSGYLVGMSKILDATWVKKRLLRLFLPLVSWATLTLIVTNNFSLINLFKFVFIDPVYWYLFVQFVFEIIYFISQKLKKYSMLSIILFLLLIVIIYKIYPCESLRQMILYYPFYFCGMFICKNNHIQVFLGKIKWLSLVLFPISMLFYSWKDYSRPEGYIKYLLNSFNIAPSVIQYFTNFMEHIGFKVFNHYIVSPLGCGFFVCLSVLVCLKTKFLKTLLEYIGQNTIYIYLLHKYFIMIFTKMSDYIFLVTIISIILCVLTSYFIKRVAFIDKIFFGSYIKKDILKKNGKC